LGNQDAEISFVEYSDLECPFCKKLHESGTIEQILKQYD
jgi:protein-disulfide isomerase